MSAVNGNCNVGCIVSKKNSDMSILMCIVIEFYKNNTQLDNVGIKGFPHVHKLSAAKTISSKI